MLVTSGAAPAAPIAGVMIQLRAKDASAAELEARARALAGWTLSINVGGAAIDFRAAGADYLHLPEAAAVDRYDPPFGRSVHSPREAARVRCAYLVAGPVWPTTGKPEGIGLTGLRAIVEAAAGVPVFAIGGIAEVEQVRAAIDAGAHGVAGIRAFTRERVATFATVMGRFTKRS